MLLVFSISSPLSASRALAAMNGATLGSKQIVVRLHEPKQLRKEKLAQRFAQGSHGGNGHPRSSSGATSPTLSEGGDSITGWSTSALAGRTRRGSGSYYQVGVWSLLGIPHGLTVPLLSFTGRVNWNAPHARLL